MPSGREMYLWWSGEAESMFVYYLTGAISIAFIATLVITRSLRRIEPIVTELLHEDNTREIMLTYMLKIVTSVFPGHGCPQSAKVFMRLTGGKKISQYFQLRSNTGGKAMLHRGFIDIFLFKVPDSLGEIKSVEFFLSGFDAPLKWKLEEVQLYSPATNERKYLPVTVTLLEVLDIEPSENVLVACSSYGKWLRIQLLFHQWVAGYGNTVRLGAFTEVVHAVCIFMSLFTLLILSQIFYIALPRGNYVVATVAPPKTVFTNSEEKADNAGTFDLNISSLFTGAILTSVGCSLFTLCIEILLRSVKSKEKDPGKAYKCLHESERSDSFKQDQKAPYEKEFKTYFTTPLFLMSKTGEKMGFEGLVDKKHKGEVALYLVQIISYLQKEYAKCMKAVELIKIKRKAIRQNLKRRQEERYLRDKNMHVDEESVYKEEEENEISVPTLSEMSLSKFAIYDSGVRPESGGSYLDILKRKRFSSTSQKFVRSSSEQFEIGFESSLKHLLYDDDYEEHDDNDDFVNVNLETEVSKEINSTETVRRKETSQVSDDLGRSQNAIRNDFDDITVLDEAAKVEECHIDIPEPEHSNTGQNYSAETEKNFSDENLCQVNEWIETSERSKASQKGFVEAWQANQKAWCRKVIKDLCDLIRSTREMVISEELNFCEVQSKLLDNSHSIVQLLLVACSVHCNDEQYRVLMSREMLCFMWHMSMEILVNILHELFQILQSRDSAVLADLVLQSHHVMLIVRHAVYPVMFMVQYGSGQLYLLRHIPLEKDLHCIFVELVKICFELVVKYNLILWQKLKRLMKRELKGYLNEPCYTQLADFVQGNIQDNSTEQIVVKRLCNYIEECSREETWNELHEEKKFYSNILIKLQVIKLMKRKITQLTKKKQKFDKVNDLLPKEPKSRLQLLVEKRRKVPDIPIDEEGKHEKDKQSNSEKKQSLHTAKHVQWNIKSGRVDSKKEKGKELGTVDPKKEKGKELEKESRELGLLIANLTVLYERLKKMFDRQGITQSVKGSMLLAQAVLHPHVVVILGHVDIAGMYQFENFLHLKRAENLLAQSYEVTVKEIVGYLLSTAVKEYNLKFVQRDDKFDMMVHGISVKIDTMAEILSEDIEAIMHQCMEIEHQLDISTMKRALPVELIVKPSVNSLLQTPSIRKWSGLDLADCTTSEMSELGQMLDEEEVDMSELLQFYRNDNSVDENNSNPGPVHTEDIHLQDHTNTWSLKDIIEDLKPVKGYLQYLKRGEMLRSFATQMGYIERAKDKRDYFNSVQINNVIDSYYMLDEGDDSKTLTKAGLYQLEHDCIGENLKPLPHWVKTLTVTIMFVLLILIIVYITIIGGQFSTAELQEWMCYYLLAVGLFGLVLEPLRAHAVALYVRRWKDKVALEIDPLNIIDVL